MGTRLWIHYYLQLHFSSRCVVSVTIEWIGKLPRVGGELERIQMKFCHRLTASVCMISNHIGARQGGKLYCMQIVSVLMITPWY